MIPVHDEKGVTIYCGDCVEVMRSMPDNSVDSIVTDPPYGIRFMGKAWDGADIEKQTATRRSYKTDAPGAGPQGGHNSAAAAAGKYDRGLTANQAFAEWTRVWCVEAFRILKPGGHMLVFCGPRTYHRMASGVEDAGFEIRDQIMWLYGSGFPKSLDIGKAIDKDNGKSNLLREFTKWFSEVSKEKTAKQIDEYLGLDSRGSTASHYRCINGKQPRFPRLEFYYKLQKWLCFDKTWDSVIIEAEREVIGKQENAMSGWNMDGSTKFEDRDMTAPATPAAQQWDGWGTALKPAHEPICVARKPLIGTVAENVLEHGTGGINIDACRIEGNWVGSTRINSPDSKQVYGDYKKIETEQHPKGRFPANLILDPEAGAMLDRQSGDCKTGDLNGERSESCSMFTGARNPWHHVGDSGGASRFFYCAKASKADRDEGLENGNTNSHPTVKPTDLMQYLVRLVTPPGGTVLDPFMGSGSTGKAAVREGFKFIGIERDGEYIPLAIARINAPAQVELI